VNLTGLGRAILNQKRTFEQNLTARAAARAFALTPAEQLLILLLIDVRAEKAADLPGRLLRAKLKSR
jgi:hypothetical protein